MLRCPCPRFQVSNSRRTGRVQTGRRSGPGSTVRCWLAPMSMISGFVLLITSQMTLVSHSGWFSFLRGIRGWSQTYTPSAARCRPAPLAMTSMPSTQQDLPYSFGVQLVGRLRPSEISSKAGGLSWLPGAAHRIPYATLEFLDGGSIKIRHYSILFPSQNHVLGGQDARPSLFAGLAFVRRPPASLAGPLGRQIKEVRMFVGEPLQADGLVEKGLIPSGVVVENSH